MFDCIIVPARSARRSALAELFSRDSGREAGNGGEIARGNWCGIVMGITFCLSLLPSLHGVYFITSSSRAREVGDLAASKLGDVTQSYVPDFKYEVSRRPFGRELGS